MGGSGTSQGWLVRNVGTMKRLTDIFLALLATLLLILPILLVAVLVRLTSPGTRALLV